MSRLMMGNSLRIVTVCQRTEPADRGLPELAYPCQDRTHHGDAPRQALYGSVVRLHWRAATGGSVSNTAKLVGTASFVHRDIISA